MPLDLHALEERRPYCHHLTDPRNLARIREEGALLSAAVLLAGAGEARLVGQQRARHCPVVVNGREVWLRDQAPLLPAGLEITGGWSEAEWVTAVNARVFFWPGDAEGPAVESGTKHFARYARREPVAVLRVPTRELVAAYRAGRSALEFTDCNSGAPAPWDPAPRGPDTFRPPGAFGKSWGKVREVTVTGRFALPPTTMVRDGLAAAWVPLVDPGSPPRRDRWS